MLRWLSGKIKSGLAKTKGAFTGVFDLLRGKGKVDQHFLDELEKTLLRADAGPQATTVIVDRVRHAFRDKEITGEVEAFVKQQLRDLLGTERPGIRWAASGPTIVMVAGVNGSGKTTSIAKLAQRLQKDGKRVLVAACDTFRAAAVEQLTIWAGRIGCEIVKQGQGADPSAVAHDACEKAKARGFDVLIVDTAGRLHT
jgi:fused signal recognition particle receptor